MRILVASIVALVGTSWATVASASSGGSSMGVSPLMIVRVRDASTIYLVGSVKCRRALCLRLLRTDNVGAAFTVVTLPPVAAVKGSATGSLNRLVFANVDDGYALLGNDQATTLYVTTNGARSWHKEEIAPGVSVYSFAATANALYVVTVRCPGANQNCVDYRIDRSSLAAAHWTSTSIPHSSFYPGGFVGAIAAYGNDVWVSEQLAGPAYVYFSSNGARTFTHFVEPLLGSVSGCDLTAMSPTSLWAQCPTGMMVSFFHSSDGGRRWTSVSPEPMSGTGGGYFDPVSAGLAYIDYGIAPHNFYRLGTNLSTADHVGELKCHDVLFAFTDALNGLAMCSQDFETWTLERTVNGGVGWKIVLPDLLKLRSN